ncbi:MAG: hypothetical protein VKJ24_17665 [Synechococcales bacterium]|nr:hypothetical protein [Synechococcales bacterium]
MLIFALYTMDSLFRLSLPQKLSGVLPMGNTQVLRQVQKKGRLNLQCVNCGLFVDHQFACLQL